MEDVIDHVCHFECDFHCFADNWSLYRIAIISWYIYIYMYNIYIDFIMYEFCVHTELRIV